MAIKNLVANCRPSAMVNRMRKHGGDVSEGDRPKLIARRTILGKTCRFYTSGEHTVDAEVTAEDSHESVLLRYAHASLIIQEPVGDKKILWVDASKNPCEVWIHDMPADRFFQLANLAIKSGAVAKEMVFNDNPVPKVKELIDGRNVRSR